VSVKSPGPFCKELWKQERKSSFTGAPEQTQQQQTMPMTKEAADKKRESGKHRPIPGTRNREKAGVSFIAIHQEFSTEKQGIIKDFT